MISPQLIYIHTSIYSKLLLSTDGFYRTKTGNTVSEFTYLDCITLSTI